MSWRGAIYRTFLMVFRALPFKRSIAFIIRFLRLPVSRVYIDLRFYGKFKTRVDDKTLRLVHYYHTSIENEIFWKGLTGGWEKESILLWKKFCSRAGVIFDVGANTGIYSLIAATVNPGAEIYAFEPSARVYEKLKYNCLLNSFTNIHCCQKAVSNHDGQSVFYDFDTAHQYSASLNPLMIENDDNKTEQVVEVVMLDSFAGQNKIQSLGLIKIDVEMHEPEVLEGFADSLARYRPVIFIEILTDDIGQSVETIMNGMGYVFYNIDETTGAVKQDNIRKGVNFNYLLCPVELSYVV